MSENNTGIKPCRLIITRTDGHVTEFENVKYYTWHDNHLAITGSNYNTVPAMNIAAVKQIIPEEDK